MAARVIQPKARSRVVLRLVGVILLYAGSLVAVDAWLFQELGYLLLRGPGTQEGQVLHKVDLASRWATEADILLFGSSMTRSCVDSEPFVRCGLLPVNLGLSGGGPVTAYHLLRSVEGQLRARRRPPIIALDLDRHTLIDPQPGRLSLGHELSQSVYVARGRAQRLESFADDLRMFRAYGIGTAYLMTLVLPSSIYRENAGVPIGHWWRGGTFQGEEDDLGYSPIVGLKGSARGTQLGPAPDWQHQKIEYLRRFIALALDLSDRVLLHSAARDWEHPPPDAFAGLAASLQSQPGIGFLPFDRDAFGHVDFHGNHLNMQGAQKNSQRILRFLEAEGWIDGAAGGASAIDQYRVDGVPSLTQWRRLGPAEYTGRVDANRVTFTGTATTPTDVQFISPPVGVVPGHPLYVLLSIDDTEGTLVSAAVIEVQGEGVARASSAGLRGTCVLRLVPATDRVEVSLGLHLQGNYRYDVSVARVVQVPWSGSR